MGQKYSNTDFLCPIPRPDQHARGGRPLLLTRSAAVISRSRRSAAPSDPFRGRDLAGRSAFSLIFISEKEPASNKTLDFYDFVRRAGIFSLIFISEKEPAPDKTG